MTVTITEKFFVSSLSGQESINSTQKYDKHSLRRAWYYSGAVYTREETGTYYYSDNGRNAYFIVGVCQHLLARGFLLSRELQHLYRKQIDAQKEERKREEEKLSQKKEIARETGKPVVIFSENYHTTASYGTNYAIAMPNGEVIGVTNGTPTASHGDRVGSSNPDAAIQAAIREYNKR